MPAVDLMTWVPAQNRWMKKYQGQMYSVSPRQLGVVGGSKAASRNAANVWWRRKQLEIEIAAEAAKPNREQYEKVLDRLKRMAAWCDTTKDMVHAHQLRVHITQLEHVYQSSDNPPPPYKVVPSHELYRIGERISEGEFYSQNIHEHWPTHADYLSDVTHKDILIWRDRLDSMAALEEQPQGRNVQTFVDQFVQKQYARVKANEIRPKSYDSTRMRLQHFADFVGGSNPVTQINGDSLDCYHTELLSKLGSKGNARETQRDRMRLAISFAMWLASKGVVELPLALLDRQAFKIKKVKKKISLWSVDEVRQLFAAKMNDRTRLFYLLMINCGMYHEDISDIRRDEVDWSEGRLRRRRTKTRDRSEDVPEVDYLLWPETFRLLKKESEPNGEYVLLNKRGGPLVSHRIRKDGKVMTSNCILVACRDKLRQLKITSNPKDLRKTAASQLEEHEVYGRYAAYFLGHSPRSIADTHYVVPSKEQFDRAIRWLGKQFGVD